MKNFQRILAKLSKHIAMFKRLFVCMLIMRDQYI